MGDCYDSGSAEAVIRSCVEPHDYEVIRVVAYPGAAGAPLPDMEADAYVEPMCAAAFETDVGRPEPLSGHTFGYLTFYWRDWEAGERSVPCVVGSRDHETKITGSVKDTDK